MPEGQQLFGRSGNDGLCGFHTPGQSKKLRKLRRRIFGSKLCQHGCRLLRGSNIHGKKVQAHSRNLWIVLGSEFAFPLCNLADAETFSVRQ